ncbi:MAG: F0F1 ATP synthase subunit B [Alphaproteobacteria bacterium]|nr:F0F1 ATP synthase subunit B [Alphaproteobacteria bacterium]
MLSDPSFWVAVAFVLFLALVGKKVWLAATASLDARAEEIKAKLDEAKQLREEAQAAKANFQRLQRDALEAAEEILAHAKEEAQRMRAEGEKKLEAALARREQLAVEKIQAAEANALQEVRGQMVDLAVAATRKLLENNLDAAARKRLVGEAIDEIPARLQ